MSKFLPDFCYIYDEVGNKTVLVKKGQKGYWDIEKNDVSPDELNLPFDISLAQQRAMAKGSLLGFNVLFSDPNNYNEDGTFIKNVIPELRLRDWEPSEDLKFCSKVFIGNWQNQYTIVSTNKDVFITKGTVNSHILEKEKLKLLFTHSNSSKFHEQNKEEILFELGISREDILSFQIDSSLLKRLPE
ncbi:hypothetical protein RAK27_18260 [Carnobacterium maltaromaticum]|uniref:Uncharacterized protein n=1 Tax=Carnobacterium maltaromaticum TaxID=2751 RepID=A0AAW9K9Y3_CARML|nr:hypothetical protein [Carnobacterium maltaromaticum]MDZ5760587.1 hypothetical protein [Carnobacterium maltaromaticum]